MKILVAMRGSAKYKPGGDFFQIQSYVDALVARGFTVDVVFGKQRIEEQYDLALLSNLDLPHETYSQLAHYSNSANKIGIITIHHADKYTQPNSFKNCLKEFVRSLWVAYSYKSPSIIFNKPRSLQKAILKMTDFIVTISNGEIESIEKDIGTIKNYIVVRNTVSIPNHQEVRQKDIDLLVVGRIEPRKNQLKILQCISSMNLKVKFIGIANKPKSYINKFKILLQNNPNIEWIQGLPRKAVFSYYQRSKVHLSLSLYEVSSYVDLEAYTCNCKVISSTNGHTDEILGGNALYVNPHISCIDLQRVIQQAVSDQKCNDMTVLYNFDEEMNKLQTFLEKINGK